MAKYEEWLQPDGLLRLEAWARDGLTDQQISDNIGINVKTLWDWKTKYDPICSALKRGKEVVDIAVENALLKRALGYEQPAVKIFQFQGEPVVVPYTERIAPDVTAQIFWLKNRRPDVWREKQNVELSGSVNNPFEGLTPDELRALINKN